MTTSQHTHPLSRDRCYCTGCFPKCSHGTLPGDRRVYAPRRTLVFVASFCIFPSGLRGLVQPTPWSVEEMPG